MAKYCVHFTLPMQFRKHVPQKSLRIINLESRWSQIRRDLIYSMVMSDIVTRCLHWVLHTHRLWHFMYSGIRKHSVVMIWCTFKNNRIFFFLCSSRLKTSRVSFRVVKTKQVNGICVCSNSLLCVISAIPMGRQFNRVRCQCCTQGCLLA